ncbi:MAG TPA: hypothetical protein VGN12_20865 [Pirellulales bacterium]|jgi:hypothetical protein
MSDEITKILIAATGGIASKDIITKLLGPSADYIGEGARSLVEKSSRNLRRIFDVACGKLGNKIDSQGGVNARVLKGVWEEGRYIEDAISAEYFGGLLAGARTTDGADDSAVPALSLLKAMSSQQLRLHFIIYSLLARYPFATKRLDAHEFWKGLHVAVSVDELLLAAQFDGGDGAAILLLATKGLIDHGLLGWRYAFEYGGLKESSGITPAFDFITLTPNKAGASLFLRALGQRGLHPELITAINVDHSLSDDIKSSVQLPPNATCYHSPVEDSIRPLHDDVEDRLLEVESDVEELKDELRRSKTDAESKRKKKPV